MMVGTNSKRQNKNAFLLRSNIVRGLLAKVVKVRNHIGK